MSLCKFGFQVFQRGAVGYARKKCRDIQRDECDIRCKYNAFDLIDKFKTGGNRMWGEMVDRFFFC